MLAAAVSQPVTHIESALGLIRLPEAERRGLTMTLSPFKSIAITTIWADSGASMYNLGWSYARQASRHIAIEHLGLPW